MGRISTKSNCCPPFKTPRGRDGDPHTPFVLSYSHKSLIEPISLIIWINLCPTCSGTISFRAHRLAIIHPKRATIKRSPIERLMSLNSTIHIQKLDMRKPPALARAAIDRDADISAFGELCYELVEVAVGSVEGDVSQE